MPLSPSPSPSPFFYRTAVGICAHSCCLLWCCCCCCCLLWFPTATTGLSSGSSAAGLAAAAASRSSDLDVSKIRAISFDVTGTLLATREPVIKSYHDACIWARLPDPPTRDELKRAFKIAFKDRSIESPCFGGVEGISGREWWRETVKRVLYHAKNGDAESGGESGYNSGSGSGSRNYDCYAEEDFQRYFRRVYQHFGSPAGYMVLEDADSLLSTIAASESASSSSNLVLGITSNTPTRHMESVLPMLDSFHDRFSWFTCSQEVAHEKPAPQIFADALEKARFWLDDPDLDRDSILHIGDSYTCDYCGARAFGFQALLLDRSDHPTVTAYQDWLEAPDYPGKSLEDVENNTITSLEEVASLLGLLPR